MRVPDGPLPPHQPHCLGCGPKNPAGLGLRMRREGDRILGEAILDSRHEGAPGFAHGGAVSTLLDDALGSVLMILERPAVTAKLEVDFRRPAFLGRRFEVEAWAERVEGRKLYLAGQMRDGREVVAEARGLFVEVEIDHFLRGADRLSASRQRTANGEFKFPW